MVYRVPVEDKPPVDPEPTIAELCDRAERTLEHMGKIQSQASHITSCKVALRVLLQAVRQLDAQVKSLVERSKP